MDIYPEIPSSGKILPIFMEGHSHDPVSGIESFLHAISMVNVYVDVQHPLVVPGWESRAAILKKTFYTRKESKHRNSKKCVLATMLIGKIQKNIQ